MSYLTSPKLSPVGNIIEDTYLDIHIVNTQNSMPLTQLGNQAFKCLKLGVVGMCQSDAERRLEI